MTTEPETNADRPFSQPATEYPRQPDMATNDRRDNRDEGNNIAFPRETAANDADRPDPQSPDSIIQMNEAAPGLEDDIQQQMENSRRETSRQRGFARTVADWFWEVDRSGLITFLADEAFAVFGCPAATLVGADFIALCTKAEDNPEPGNNFDQPAQSLDSLFERRSSFRNMPFYITNQDQQKSLWYLSAIAIFDIHTGRFAGFRGSARAEIAKTTEPLPTHDVTMPPGQQEESLENYVATQALKAVEQEKTAQAACSEEIAAELLQNLSHEFRTPLNAIIGFSEMINMETWGPVNKSYHQNIKNILAAAFQLKEAVNDVLDSAKLEAGLMQIAPESFSLKAVLKNCRKNVDAMARDKHLQFLDNDNNIDVILYNDMQSVELCLTKMLTSTIKRAHDGEIITLSVLINSNARIRIEIPVLGPGIEEKNAERMFQKLEITPDAPKNQSGNNIKTTPKIAPGFGLSIAQSLAQLIGGDISTHSTHGYLTHLVLTLRNHDPAGNP
ncbi:MAG: HAMP domain-containing histidine kinase [Alphaproteobacteria bacterium]|nr:HAMP domain-containing histidine kinase [Alphaproteobacteria bacterium]